MSNPFDLGSLGNMMAGLQQSIADSQAAAANLEVEGQAGGGMVRVVCDGQFVVKSVRLREDALQDRELLEDLLVAACNDAVRKARDHMAEQAKSMMGGLPLPAGMLDDLLGG